jgi:hypothetical protein
MQMFCRGLCRFGGGARKAIASLVHLIAVVSPYPCPFNIKIPGQGVKAFP